MIKEYIYKKYHIMNKLLKISFFFCFLLISCGSDDGGDTSGMDSMSETSQGNNSNPNQPGVITAGEWNDLKNWFFWENVINIPNYKSMPTYWSIYNNNRVSVDVKTSTNTPVINALIKLKNEGETIFITRTDNKGKAELWVDLLQQNTNVNFSKLSIEINDGTAVLNNVIPYKEGTNNIIIPEVTVDNRIEISFVVDATGSMGDELEYLKTELLDVVSKIKTDNPNSTIYTSSVFYRDENDDYVYKISPFTNNENLTINFIKDQSAGGGGDFPEAVHTALDKAINELQWSSNAKTRILFLLLDAPPHHNLTVISKLQQSLLKAAEKGIKIIPITASGIDKETEFLMRFFAITTNGTYLFITNDSGIGNSHLEPTVGEYQVEYLNKLIIRIINEYSN